MPERRPSEPSCPICGRPIAKEFRPFCSRRCADVDLGRWLTGQYRVPAVEEEGEEGGEPA
ncbi:MAG TPA: DNA gyrase inhibitor YacG [Acetobacteraceae bacterium]